MNREIGMWIGLAMAITGFVLIVLGEITGRGNPIYPYVCMMAGTIIWVVGFMMGGTR